jgi:phosphohistidine phosphatase
MKRLLLLRHAKAGPQNIEGDYGRALAPRGRRNAPLVGKAMRKAGFIPDAVLCSDAVRTRQTWELVAQELKAEPDVRFTDALYLAPWKVILGQAREFPASADTAMMVGHNPGMEDCAAALLGPEANGQERALHTEMAGKFPTAALAVIDCDIAAWNDLATGCGRLVAFIKPRDLD